jgi:hypothetical protein
MLEPENPTNPAATVAAPAPKKPRRVDAPAKRKGLQHAQLVKGWDTFCMAKVFSGITISF